MKILWNWLLEYCDLDRAMTAEQGAAALTKAGLEVEGLTDLGAGFSGVVVAEVVSKKPHPSADKLNIVSVITARGGEVTEVVCGAPNVPAPGRKVLWAQIGATLPGGMTLAAKPVKGVVSPGMLCSEVELAIGDDDDGIIVLAESDTTPLGAPAQVAVGVDDWMFEIKAPANRGDILGHVGMARELVSIVGGRVVLPNVDASAFTDVDAKVGFAVEIADATRCERYVARRIRGLAVAPAPRKMRQRLRNVGVRPINNLVDVTNYVMFELGQPLHAFDAAKLQHGKIVVRNAVAGSKFTTLDSVERTLVADDLLICDGATPVALAGVMGGLDSEVTSTTTDVLLESAGFTALGVRRTGRRLGLHSEASHRFERNVDPAMAEFASARAAFLLGQMGGQIAGEVVDANPAPRKLAPVVLRHARLHAIAGATFAADTAERILRQLGCTIEASTAAELTVTPPTHRFDLGREIDLIEEVLRLGGYDAVPDTIPRLRQAPALQAPDRQDVVRHALVQAGLSEAITFGFTSETRVQSLGLPPDDRRATSIPLKNPMSLDQAVMRTSLLPNLLGAVARNASFGEHDCALFEVGSVFLARPRDPSLGRDAGLADEQHMVVGVLSGKRPAQLAATTAWDVFDAKGFAERAIEAVSNAPVVSRATATVPYLHPGLAGELMVNGLVVGHFGEVHPAVRAKFGIDGPVFAFEIALAALPSAAPRQMTSIAKFPGTSRDISLLVDNSVPASRAAEVVAAQAHPLVQSIRVLEEFRDAKLPPGTKSMLYSISYRAADRTLTDADVETVHTALVKQLVQELGAQQR
ncbi:MAG TPA: phenylalanine--tRNA ligase subunit beta [Kofleriaceae bacterium]|nr:phenylalanine--tRNA ligase subunit beta [Kofleriaceae bacterium]